MTSNASACGSSFTCARNPIGSFPGNSWAQLTMNSSALLIEVLFVKGSRVH